MNDRTNIELNYVYPPDFPTRTDVIRGVVGWTSIVFSERVKGPAGLAVFAAGVVIGKPFVQRMLAFDGECQRYEAAGGSFQDILSGTAQPIPLPSEPGPP